MGSSIVCGKDIHKSKKNEHGCKCRSDSNVNLEMILAQLQEAHVTLCLSYHYLNLKINK
jgi:hypothetical protein